MASIDVSSQIVVERPRADVAAYTTDPDNAPNWYAGIESVEWQGEHTLRVGTRVRFRAHFLGRHLDYDVEVTDFVPGDHLSLRVVDGPFPMETEYRFESLGDAQTRVTQTHRGMPSGFARLAARVLMYAMHRTPMKDLQQLKVILEKNGGTTH
jgi:uncharacterized membrane protein